MLGFFALTNSITFLEIGVENRWGERFETDTNVFIYRFGAKLAQGIIKNRSRFGMFIESTLSDLIVLQLIDIRLVIGKSISINKCYRFNSIIIHTTQTGFGIEYDSIDELISGESARISDL